jgi:hypothetical protein
MPISEKETTLYIASLRAAFTILLSTRHINAPERHEGLVAAIAFESMDKRLTFLALGIFLTFVLHDRLESFFQARRCGIESKLCTIAAVSSDSKLLRPSAARGSSHLLSANSNLIIQSKPPLQFARQPERFL